MNAVATGFVTGRRNDATTIRLPAHNDGFAAQVRALEQLDGNEESVHVDVKNGRDVQREGGRLAFGAKMSEPGHKFWRYCLTCSVDEQNSRRYTGLLRAHPVAQGEPTTYGQKKVSFRFSLLGGRTIGSTSDSGSDYPGSSPGLPAKSQQGLKFRKGNLPTSW